jgi:hypothetical protein
MYDENCAFLDYYAAISCNFLPMFRLYSYLGISKLFKSFLGKVHAVLFKTVRDKQHLCPTHLPVSQYSETNVMHFLFSLLRIKGLYIFRAHLRHQLHSNTGSSQLT